MNLVRQPKGSNLCGQACVATVAGLTLEESIEKFGSKGCTTTKQLRNILGNLGIETSSRLRRGRPTGGIAIVKFVHPNKRSHWVVWKKGKYYDPIAGIFRKLPNYLTNSRQTSFLELKL